MKIIQKEMTSILILIINISQQSVPPCVWAFNYISIFQKLFKTLLYNEIFAKLCTLTELIFLVIHNCSLSNSRCFMWFLFFVCMNYMSVWFVSTLLSVDDSGDRFTSLLLLLLLSIYTYNICDEKLDAFWINIIRK